ncbi:MAG: DNA-3-methyladenine glycosylase, partial [Nitriliruptorales bacterium]
YFTYGMHFCMNVSTEPEGTGSAVLLRAAAVVVGEDHVRHRRGQKHRERDLVRGPGRLAQGLGVDRDWNGVDLLDPAAPLRLAADGWSPPPEALREGPRVGIRAAAEEPWRFWIEGLPEVSRYTRHPRAE